MFLAVPSPNLPIIGPQGAQGPQGAAGIGSQGPQGVPGSGSQGPQGVPGIGTQGPQGVPGVGTQGLQGPQGVPGAAFSTITTMPTLTLIQPSTWSFDESAARVTKVGGLVGLQLRCVITGPTPYTDEAITIEFTLPKPTFATPVPLNPPDASITNSPAYVGGAPTPVRGSVGLYFQDGISVTYRFYAVAPLAVLPAGNLVPVEFDGSWLAV